MTERLARPFMLPDPTSEYVAGLESATGLLMSRNRLNCSRPSLAGHIHSPSERHLHSARMAHQSHRAPLLVDHARSALQSGDTLERSGRPAHDMLKNINDEAAWMNTQKNHCPQVSFDRIPHPIVANTPVPL